MNKNTETTKQDDTQRLGESASMQLLDCEDCGKGFIVTQKYLDQKRTDTLFKWKCKKCPECVEIKVNKSLKSLTKIFKVLAK